MAGRSQAWRHWAWVVTAVCAVAFEARCGARSGLPLPETCGKPGELRHCHDSCGEGEQVCQYGFWQACVVPSASRACSNTCGTGVQSCVDEGWLPCVVPVTTRACSSVCGPGTETCTDDVWGSCSAPLPGPPTLGGTVRNAAPGNLDFLTFCCTNNLGPDLGIVAPTLGADGKPVYTGNPNLLTSTTHGAMSFDQWYNDGAGVTSRPLPLPLMPQAGQPGVNVFDNEAFFPLGDPVDCTLEAHGEILYVGGETYDFASDDDLWVFINRGLVVDLGGLHSAMPASVNLDQVASQVGLVKGQVFPLDIFYANREPPGAVLMMSIPQSDLWSCP